MESLEDLLTFLEKKIENVSAELSCAPPGTLMLITEDGCEVLTPNTPHYL